MRSLGATRERETVIWATTATILLLLAGVPTLSLQSSGQGQAVGQTTVFTPVPEPGSPEGIAVIGGTVYVGTHTPVYGNGGGPPSTIFAFDLATGQEIDRWEVAGQATGGTHGLLGMTYDGEGRLYVLDRAPARVLRFDLSTDPPTQETYATLANLPTCQDPLAGPGPCSPNTVDQAPVPDGIVFDQDGYAYVTDLEQAVLWRVPPGGGQAEAWFTDARLDSVFATNGIALGPGGLLHIAMTGQLHPWAASLGQPALTTQGVIYTLPTVEAPAAEDLGVLHVFPEPAAGPDGLAFGATGRIYAALAGHSQIAVLAPWGEELARFPGLVENQQRAVPYDLPASLAFDGQGGLLVTNQAYFTGNSAHWAVLRAQVGDLALPQPHPAIG